MDEPEVNRANGFLSFLLAPTTINNNISNSLKASQPYPTEAYLNDVFSAVWKPINAADKHDSNFRRSVENQYVSLLGTLINVDNVAKGEKAKAVQADVILYALQHLNKVESYCMQQQKALQGGDINALHYSNLLTKIKRIRKQYEKAE